MPEDGIDALREVVFAGDNRACFIERETIRHQNKSEALALPECERYLFEFEKILEGVSTPIHPEDRILGRVVEARWNGEKPWYTEFPGALFSEGHTTFDYPALLTKGLRGMVDEAVAAAKADPTGNKVFFAAKAQRALMAIRAYARRYAQAARQAAAEADGESARNRFLRAAKALETVPDGPAYDFFSALQSIWLMHMIFSAYVGQRDFCFGRIDQYLLRWYALGAPTEAEAVELLAHFLLKTNELAGRATDDYNSKPVPCHASKQYIVLSGHNIDGECEYNLLSELILKAAERIRLPQPTLNWRYSPQDPEAVLTAAGEAAAKLDAQMNFFNDDLILPLLLSKGIKPEDACQYTFTACNRVEIPQKMYNIMRRIDVFDRNCTWFVETLNQLPETATMAEIFAGYRENALRHFRAANDEVANLYTSGPCFNLESLGYPSCRKSATDIYQGGTEEYRLQHHMFNGIATIADSLAAIDQMVFQEKRYSLAEFLAIVRADFAGHEPLRQELLNRVPKFGNDLDAVDQYAVRIANLLLDAYEQAGAEAGFLSLASFYSLSQHQHFGRELAATPDGRHAGETLSENQSPVYGMDRHGPTAVLKSVAKLPLARTVCGGLNLKLAFRPDPIACKELLRSAFGMGILHVGLTLVDRATLEAAQRHPEAYRSLCVRKYGFSEFFIALSPEFQKELIERTEY